MFYISVPGLYSLEGLQHTIYHLLNCHSGDIYRNEIRFLISFMMTYCRYFSFLFWFLLPIYKGSGEFERAIVFFYISKVLL